MPRVLAKSAATIVLLALAVPAFAAGARDAIQSTNAKFSSLFAKGDEAGVTALYAADAAVMPAGSEPVRGTQAIQKFWQGGIDSGVVGVEVKTVEVYEGGKTATEVGQYRLLDKAGKTLDSGKYIVIWKQEGGDWKLFRDMFSSNQPPPKH
jgi:ketosteroid isomerase-like protein